MTILQPSPPTESSNDPEIREYEYSCNCETAKGFFVVRAADTDIYHLECSGCGLPHYGAQVWFPE